ncbi:MAG TPA: 7-carboxy-7-deazaguanine synthase [Terriglobales bacterium]
MQITEIYKSLQGESSWAGLPCIFVRLTACNLRCSWCDSEYTFSGGVKMSGEQVEAEIVRLSRITRQCTPDYSGLKPARNDATFKETLNVKGWLPLVEITGGEPMLQEREVVPLMQRLLDSGYTVLLETSGERPLHKVPPQVVKIVDVKCPHSGAPNTFRMENLQALGARAEVKFVLSDRGDYEFAREFIGEHELARRVHSVILSPAFRKDATGARDASHCLLDPRELADWMLEDGVPARLGLQIHKFVWDPALKGV